MPGGRPLEADPDSLGSLGPGDLRGRGAAPPPTRGPPYSLGSVLNHVLMHQTVIGLEAKEQLAAFGE